MKDYTGWEVVDNNGSAPAARDYSGWEVVQDEQAPATRTPPPSSISPEDPGWVRFLKGVQENPFAASFRSGVEGNTYGALQGLFNQLGMDNAQNALSGMNQERNQRYEDAQARSPAQAFIGNLLGNIGGFTAAYSPLIAAAPPVLGGFPAAIGEGALYGASQYVEPGQDRMSNSLEGGLYGGVGQGIIKGLPKLLQAGKNAISPSAASVAKQASQHLPEAELLARQAATRGTSTPIGDVIGSADLKKAFENRIVPSTLSGGSEKLASLEGQIADKTSKIVDGIGTQYFGKDTDELLKNTLTSAYKTQQKAKTNLYDTVNKIADKEKFDLRLKGFGEKARDSMDVLQDSIVTKLNPKLKSTLNKISTAEHGVSGATSLKDAQMLASTLSEEAQKFRASPLPADRRVSGLFGDLAKTLREDIKSEVSDFGSKELKESLYRANQNYAKNFSGFLDKNVYKLLSEGKDADGIIKQIMGSGKNLDKASNIKKIQNLLPEKDRNLLGYGLISKAFNENGMLDPRKVSGVLNNIGDRQLKALFPDQQVHKQLIDLKKLYSLNPEALNRMFNPKTGARNVETGNIVKNLIGGGLGSATIGSLPSAGLAGANILRNRHLVNKFTDEAFRDAVIKEITKGSKKAASSAKSSNILKNALTPSRTTNAVINTQKKDNK